METRSIGKLDASIVGLGCNNFGGRIDKAATQRVVSAALNAGITLFDTADIYGGTLSESISAGRSDPAGTKRSSPRSSAAPSTMNAKAARARPTSPRGGRQFAPARYRSSISISCTFPTPPRRSRRRSKRSTASSARARCSRSAPATSRPSRSTTRPVSGRARLRSFRERPERIQPAAGGPERFGVLDASSAERGWVHSVLYSSRAVCSRASTTATRRRRQEHDWRGCPRIAPTTHSPTRCSIGSRRSTVTHTITGTRCSSPRSPGCSHDRPWRA